MRYDKKIIGTNKIGDLTSIIRSDDITKEALHICEKIQKLRETISFKDIAIVYRTNIQSRAFIDVFMHMNIPFQVKDETNSIYEHWIAKDIFAYLKLALDRNQNESFERIINKPNRYISKAILSVAKRKNGYLLENIYNASDIKVWQLKRIEELMFYLNAIKSRNTFDAFKYIRQAIEYNAYLKTYSEYRKMTSKGLFEVLDELQESSKYFPKIEDFLSHAEDVITKTKNNKVIKKKSDFDSVTLSTMHGVKGLEYNTVFISSVVEGVIPYEKSKTDDELEEECRLLYVGMTRAKHKLFISIIKSRYEEDVEPSRFLKKILNMST